MKPSSKLPTLLQKFREIFIPDLTEMIASIVGAVVMYLIFSANYFWDLLFKESSESSNYSDNVLSVAVDLNDLPNASSVITAILWGIAGILVYCLILFIFNSIIKTRNNVLLNSQLINKPKILAFSLINEYRRIFWIVLFAIIMWTTVVISVPFWADCFNIFNYNHSEIHILIMSLLGMAYNLYVIYSSFVALLRNPKIF